MLTIDELLQAYDDGDITRNELFGHLLTALAPAQMETVRERLNREAGRLEAFEEWVAEVASGAALFSGSRPRRISDDARAAIARWRDRTRPLRYKKLASRMQQCLTEAHEGEATVEPDDIEPFRSTDIERWLVEAA